jgi:hypothetical protein
VEDHVVEPVIAMDERRRALLGDALGESLVDAFDEWDLAGLRSLPLLAPSTQLAGDVILFLAELAEPDLVGHLGVDPDQGVDDPLADRPAAGLVEGLGVRAQPQDRARDELHHVEGSAVDGLVGAVAGDRCDRDRRRGERRDDAMLAAHVVGRAERLAERRPPQGPLAAIGIGHPIGQIGAAAGDPLVAERTAGAGHVRLQPGTDLPPVDPLRYLATLAHVGAIYWHCHRIGRPLV